MNATLTAETARVWIACLACYNDGRLVGDWFAATDAEDVSLADIHAEYGGERVDCEEVWVFDTDNLPVSREMSVTEASEWGRLLDEVDEWQRAALIAWVRTGDYVAEGHGDLPSLPDFEERYAGEWESFREYAEQFADEVGVLSGVDRDSILARYFDWNAWTRDLAFEYSTAPAPGGGVYVFRDL